MAEIDLIGLDMDGVLCNMVKSAMSLYGLPIGESLSTDGKYDVARATGVSKTQFWKRVKEAGPAFWANLELYPWTIELINACKMVAPTIIITKPPHTVPEAACGKIEWIYEHFGRTTEDYVITPSKHLLAQPNRLLIDDDGKNTKAWTKAGGRAILFPQPWNDSILSVEDVIEYVRTINA